MSIIFIDVGSTKIELIGRPAVSVDGEPGGGLHHLALQVESVDETFAFLVDKGVRIRSEPRNLKEVRIAFFYDPDGNILELVEDPRHEEG